MHLRTLRLICAATALLLLTACTSRTLDVRDPAVFRPARPVFPTP